MLKSNTNCNGSQKTLAELTAALPLWNDMTLEPINNAVEDFNYA